MQAIDFSSIGLSLVYFDSSVWRNKFKRGEGDASNPFRGCARFPRRAPVEIKAQLRRRLRSHPSTRATIETKLRPRAVQSLCLYFFFIFFLFFFTHAIPLASLVDLGGHIRSRLRKNTFERASISFHFFLSFSRFSFF